MKTGRMDSKISYAAEVDNFIPNHNDTISLILSRFQSIGVDTEGTVALLGLHQFHYYYSYKIKIIKKKKDKYMKKIIKE